MNIKIEIIKRKKKGLTTGYNIKDKKEYANFNEDYTVSYGHNDIIHASQIIGLLKGEKIDAKVQLEIKTSAFIYLPEWGESRKCLRRQGTQNV